MDGGYLGEIRMFGGNFAPRAWALCNGQLLSISENQALFSILGTIYGGDGRTTFKLPDLRGRAAMHPGTGPGLTPRSLGQTGGTETNTLNVTQIPAHSHTLTKSGGVNVTVNNSDGDVATPGGNYLAGHTAGLAYNTNAGSGRNNELSGVSEDLNFTAGNTGGGQSVNNVQPFQCVNYIICLQGLYPSRN